MAGEGGASHPALDRIARQLEDEPFVFEFFQAVRLVERLSRGRVPVGRFAKPQDEAARFAANNVLTFPPSEIHSFSWRAGEPPRMVVNFMGLTGPQGMLPLYYTQLLAERAKARDTAPRDFLDIFNHRIISLFYQAWEKYRFGVEHERGGRDKFFHHLLDLIGLGTAGLQNRQAVPDHSLAYYAGLLAQHPHSALGFRQLLEDYFEVPVEIEQFAGAWYKLNPDLQCRLDERLTDSERLAFGAVLGDEVWHEQSRVCIRLGPLTLDQYLDFLPCGTACEPLHALARLYVGDEVDFAVQLVLRREEAPACELGREDEGGPRLGWVTWAKSAPMQRDPADAILEL